MKCLFRKTQRLDVNFQAFSLQLDLDLLWHEKEFQVQQFRSSLVLLFEWCHIACHGVPCVIQEHICNNFKAWIYFSQWIVNNLLPSTIYCMLWRPMEVHLIKYIISIQSAASNRNRTRNSTDLNYLYIKKFMIFNLCWHMFIIYVAYDH